MQPENRCVRVWAVIQRSVTRLQRLSSTNQHLCVYKLSLTAPSLNVCSQRSLTIIHPPLLLFPCISWYLYTCLTTCGSHLSYLTVLLPSPPPSLPQECAHCVLPSIRLVIGRSGAVGEDCVGLGSFPCSDYPGPFGGNGAPAARAFAAPSSTSSSSSHFFSVFLCPPPLHSDK